VTAPLQRKGTYPIEDVLIHVRGNTSVKNKNLLYQTFDGDKVKIRSDRLLLFKNRGTRCVGCGIEGKYFAKEKHSKDRTWHFNLYAVDREGNEVLMTKDHIQPKAKGGKDAQYNYQPMCRRCNVLKGDTMPKQLPSKKKTKLELEKEVARLKSMMGSRDSTVSRLTRENKNKDKEIRIKQAEVAHLKAENEILKTRIRQLMEMMMSPVVVTEKTSGG
jgi:hypothetical protein